MCLLSLFKIEKKNCFKNQNECPSCLSSPLTVTDWATLLPALSAGQLVLADSSWTPGYIISNARKSWHHHIGFVTFRIVVIQAFLANVHVQLMNLFWLQPLISRGQRACRHQRRAAHSTRLFGSFSNYELFAWLKTSHRPFHPYELDLRKSKQKGRSM